MLAGSPAWESWLHILQWDEEGQWTGRHDTLMAAVHSNTRERKATQPPITMCTSGAKAEESSQLSRKKKKKKKSMSPIS